MFQLNIISGRAALTEMAVQKLNEIGVVVVSITTDNPTSNWRMFEILGAKLYSKTPKVSLDLANCRNIPIFVTLDACHLIKLIRNALGDCGTFISPSGESIKWSYLVRLNNLQKEKGLHLANKLQDKPGIFVRI